MDIISEVETLRFNDGDLTVTTEESGDVTLTGTDQVYTITVVGAGGTTIEGLAGADKLLGGAGDDVIIAAASDDVIDGGAGIDTITGGEGNDDVFGKAGADGIDGRVGNDTDDRGPRKTPITRDCGP